MSVFHLSLDLYQVASCKTKLKYRQIDPLMHFLHGYAIYFVYYSVMNFYYLVLYCLLFRLNICNH